MPDGTIGLVFQQLIPASAIYRVIKRSASTIAEAANAGLKQLNVIGEVLRYLAMAIKAHHKSAIKPRPERVLSAADSGLFFRMNTAAHGAAGVKERATPK